MKGLRLSLLLTSLAAAATAAGCGEPDDPDPPASQDPVQCQGLGYVAFDAANHMNQDLRLGAFQNMAAKMKSSYDPQFSAAAAATLFAEAESLYENSASLRDKVKGRKDVHFMEEPAVGIELDANIMAGLAQGKTATTALAAKLAKQKVEKNLIRFLYLSVYYEMTIGAKKEWDEGYGYFGSGSSNAEANRRGLARVATSRDSTNGTNLEAEIFNGIVDGSCALAKALAAQGAGSVDWKSVPELKATVEGVDRKLQLVLAYSAGHEAFEMEEHIEALPQDPSLTDEIWIKLAELDPYFASVEDTMIARGGESRARAERIRQKIDAAWAALPRADWMAGFDAAGILADLEAEFGIDVRG